MRGANRSESITEMVTINSKALQNVYQQNNTGAASSLNVMRQRHLSLSGPTTNNQISK